MKTLLFTLLISALFVGIGLYIFRWRNRDKDDSLDSPGNQNDDSDSWRPW